jgi:hypothetical protein
VIYVEGDGGDYDDAEGDGGDYGYVEGAEVKVKGKVTPK